MSKASTVNSREIPVGRVALSAAGFAVRAEMLLVQSDARIELVDLTERVQAVFINEAQTALHADIKTFL